jgi:hypothetical protein
LLPLFEARCPSKGVKSRERERRNRNTGRLSSYRI